MIMWNGFRVKLKIKNTMNMNNYYFMQWLHKSEKSQKKKVSLSLFVRKTRNNVNKCLVIHSWRYFVSVKQNV